MSGMQSRECRLHREGAFVVQFRSGSTLHGGRLAGRIEHVASGVTAEFDSWEQFLEVFTRVLKEVPWTNAVIEGKGERHV